MLSESIFHTTKISCNLFLAFSCFNQIHFLYLRYFHHGITLYLVDGHFIQDIHGIFVRGIIIGFNDHDKIPVQSCFFPVLDLPFLLLFALISSSFGIMPCSS